jgi:hypothetical protein
VRFAPGAVITKREVWDGAVWLEHPVVVESDDGPDGVLATRLEPGSAFSFPSHPGGPHPWSHQEAWGNARVLQLRRNDDWYAVWKFFDLQGQFECWYVNFERPVVRTVAGIDTDDLELDLVVLPDGQRRWKDVEALAGRLDQGRLGVDDLVQVLRAAADVTDLLDRDDRWWSAWDGWTPETASWPPPTRS